MSLDIHLLSIVRPGEKPGYIKGAKVTTGLMSGACSAGRVYNRLMGSVKDKPDYWVLAHADVEFPFDWHANLKEAVKKIGWQVPEHGPLGVVGVRGNATGKEWYGQIWDKDREVGRGVFEATRVDTLDEVCVILRSDRDWWLNDKDLMRHHLWATELCLRESEDGHKSYVLPGLYLRHLSQTPREVSDPAFYFNAGAIHTLHGKPGQAIATTCCTIFDPGDDSGVQITS